MPYRVHPVFRDTLEFLLSKAAQKAFEITESGLEKYDLTPREYATIRLIDGHQYSQQAIADFLQVNRNAMVVVIGALERRSIARRIRNAQNRREHIIELTDKGTALLHSLQQESVLMTKQLTSVMKESEVKSLKTLLLRLLESQV